VHAEFTRRGLLGTRTQIRDERVRQRPVRRAVLPDAQRSEPPLRPGPQPRRVERGAAVGEPAGQREVGELTRARVVKRRGRPAHGGGLPISAVTGRTEIMDAAPAGGLGGTYAGNPVACAAALGALETIESEGLVKRARAIGEHVLPTLTTLKDEHPAIGDVRGRGAMLALEFSEPGTDAPAPAVAARVAKYCHEHGVLVLVCGTYSNVIRLLPPLVIEFGLLDDALSVLADAIEAAVQ